MIYAGAPLLTFHSIADRRRDAGQARGAVTSPGADGIPRSAVPRTLAPRRPASGSHYRL